MPLTIGSRLEHYEVTTLIGDGEMVQFYQATEAMLNRPVVLKILPDAFASDHESHGRFV